MPILYIIAGPNGAGKTTSAESLLPGVLNCVEFLNADLIAKGISPYNTESVAIQAGRIMLQRMNDLVNAKVNFVIETTLSTLSYGKFIGECKQKGYDIVLIYIWLNHPDIAVERVAQRVSRGGHNIPEDVIRRRYFKGLKNLNKIFVNLSAEWIIADNSDKEIELIARKDEFGISIFNQDKYKLIYND